MIENITQKTLNGINSTIRPNGEQSITGLVLNEALRSILDTKVVPDIYYDTEGSIIFYNSDIDAINRGDTLGDEWQPIFQAATDNGPIAGLIADIDTDRIRGYFLAKINGETLNCEVEVVSGTEVLAGFTFNSHYFVIDLALKNAILTHFPLQAGSVTYGGLNALATALGITQTKATWLMNGKYSYLREMNSGTRLPLMVAVGTDISYGYNMPQGAGSVLVQFSKHGNNYTIDYSVE